MVSGPLALWFWESRPRDPLVFGFLTEGSFGLEILAEGPSGSLIFRGRIFRLLDPWWNDPLVLKFWKNDLMVLDLLARVSFSHCILEERSSGFMSFGRRII